MRKIICILLCSIMLVPAFACIRNDEADDPVSEWPTSTQSVLISPSTSSTPYYYTTPYTTPNGTTSDGNTPGIDPTDSESVTLVPVPTATAKPTPKPTPYCNPVPTSSSELKLANAGKKFMAKLKATEGYEKLDLKAKAGYPYLICINNINSCVTVFCVDENGEYTRPYLSMICTGGSDTPEGIFKTPARYSWHVLMGPCYGQYCTRIVGGILFHSVPYNTMHKYDLMYKSFNRLGWIISHGCVRLAVNDSKWIYDNCPLGTTVVIYNDKKSAGPMGRPQPIRIDASNLFLRGWDPTDPDKANPYGDEFKAGSTLRSELARADYEYAMAHNTWNSSINPPERPTPTPDFTPTPKPTATPELTPTPAPTETPDVTATPELTPAPTPRPTPTSYPTTPPRPTPPPHTTPTPTVPSSPGA